MILPSGLINLSRNGSLINPPKTLRLMKLVESLGKDAANLRERTLGFGENGYSALSAWIVEVSALRSTTTLKRKIDQYGVGTHIENFASVDEIRQRIKAPIPYAEFLRIPAMSCGVYVLKPGADDMQRPHNEDEIYHVFSGASRMSLTPANRPTEDRAIAAGDLIFVAARDEHRFHSITQEVVLLVIFAPAVTMSAQRI
jgi:mannose-6-phosphate isomerase-like protein (cupin superfamily)